MATVSYPHISTNAEGTPVIEGTRIKVVLIARGGEPDDLRNRVEFLPFS